MGAVRQRIGASGHRTLFQPTLDIVRYINRRCVSTFGFLPQRHHGDVVDIAFKAAAQTFRARAPLIRECFVGRSPAHARAASQASLGYKYRAYAAWGHTDTKGHDTLTEKMDIVQ